MARSLGKTLTVGVAGLLVAGLVLLVVWRIVTRTEPQDAADAPMAMPVETSPIERGTIHDRRTFSGTLEPRWQFIVAPKVSGRVVALHVDVGDAIQPGALVAELDDDEFVQAVAQARADLEVARATLVQAQSALEIASREYERIQALRQRNIASESALDAAEADRRAKAAQVEVARAQVQRAEAALASEQVRLGYATVTAQWSGGEPRIVSQRYIDAGGTVAANDPIVTVVDLATVRAAVFVTERDYGRLRVGQEAVITTDAYPGETFMGRVLRLAPVFEEESRQARVEIEVPNPDLKLKAGMYVRVNVTLGVAEDAVIVPLAAVTRRGEERGVFVLDESGEHVRWTPVTLGIQEGNRVQVIGEGLAGSVVTLGQQLLDDGSEVRVAQRRGGAAAEAMR